MTSVHVRHLPFLHDAKSCWRWEGFQKEGTLIAKLDSPGLNRAMALRQANSAGSTCKFLKRLVISCRVLMSPAALDAFPFGAVGIRSGVANSGDVSIGMLHWMAHNKNSSAHDSSSRITCKINCQSIANSSSCGQLLFSCSLRQDWGLNLQRVWVKVAWRPCTSAHLEKSMGLVMRICCRVLGVFLYAWAHWFFVVAGFFFFFFLESRGNVPDLWMASSQTTADFWTTWRPWRGVARSTRRWSPGRAGRWRRPRGTPSPPWAALQGGGAPGGGAAARRSSRDPPTSRQCHHLQQRPK